MTDHNHYTPTEAKYKGTADEYHITYDLEQKTRGNSTATYPKVKRVYIAGDVRHWETGDFEKQSGKTVHGVRIQYEQRRAGYDRKGYTAERNGTTYRVPPTHVEPSVSRFVKVVEIPEAAENVELHDDSLPEKYQSALQNVR